MSEKRARGIDFYQRWQPNYLCQKFHDFVMIKVAEGNWVAEHSRVWEQAKKVPVKVAYIYLRSGISAKTHVDTILRATRNNSYQPDGYMVDFEKRGNTPSMQFGQIFKDTAERLEGETGKRTLKYSNRSTVHEYLYWYGHRDWPKEDDNWVIAQYVFKKDSWGTPNALQFLKDVFDLTMWNAILPAGFMKPKFWQYSADGNNQGPLNGIGEYNAAGEGPAIDLQVFDGTRDQLLTYFNKEIAVPQPPEIVTPSPIEILTKPLELHSIDTGMFDGKKIQITYDVSIKEID